MDTTQRTPEESLGLLLKTLRLPSFHQHWADVAIDAENGGWSFGQFLHHLAQLEMQHRSDRRIVRALKSSKLPCEKTLGSLQLERLPTKVQRALPRFCRGGFVERGDNVLVFGLPGRGKTHLVCAIGHELIRNGYRVLFSPTSLLVQRLLAAKRDLALERELRLLDKFDAVILDDLGYVQQDRAEMEVLFTFLAQRYERKSVLITSNLVFSQWDQIFKDPMTTAAAIDRLVHHSTIVELVGPSFRSEAAAKAMASSEPTTTTAEASRSTTTTAEASA